MTQWASPLGPVLQGYTPGFGGHAKMGDLSAGRRVHGGNRHWDGYRISNWSSEGTSIEQGIKWHGWRPYAHQCPGVQVARSQMMHGKMPVGCAKMAAN